MEQTGISPINEAQNGEEPMAHTGRHLGVGLTRKQLPWQRALAEEIRDQRQEIAASDEVQSLSPWQRPAAINRIWRERYANPS